MKTYRMNDRIMAAGSSHDLINQLMENSWQAGSGLADFMRGMAHRVEMQTGHAIRTDSADNFVADLLESKALQEV
jgi:hypothetical protein